MIELTQDTRPDKDKPLEKPTELGLTPAWSYSALKTFEECAYRTYISKVKKVREESGPAAQRGTEIHQQAEDYVNGKIGDLPDTLLKFKNEFEILRRLYDEAKVELEGEWGFSIDWKPVAWFGKDTWARIKLDALVNQDETSARVMRYPHLDYIQTEMWYLDKGETTIKSYTRDQAMIFMPGIHRRAIKMTTATRYDPTPSKTACRWCSYSKGDEPQCVWGVT